MLFVAWLFRYLSHMIMLFLFFIVFFIVCRCIEPDPDDRYTSIMAEAVRELKMLEPFYSSVSPVEEALMKEMSIMRESIEFFLIRISSLIELEPLLKKKRNVLATFVGKPLVKIRD